jgi:selenocysteine lyase/cysteine desulfurase
MIFNNTLLFEIQNEFPRARTDTWGNSRVFFDNGTGTLVLRRSAEAQYTASLEHSANPGDSFRECRESGKLMENGLQAVADLVNAESSENIISAQSATALFFQLSYALGNQLEKHHNIVTTYYEHLSNIDPWRELVRRGVVKELRFARLHQDGTLDIDHLESLVDENTKVVTVSAASNLLGSKSPLADIGKIARRAGAYYVVDAVHHAAHGPLDVQETGCDFMVISAYKFFTPKYISFMYGKLEHLESMRPYSAGKDHGTLHAKWHWGSPDQAKYAAVNATIGYLAWLGDRVKENYNGKYSSFRGRPRSLKIALDAIDQYEKEISLAILSGIDGQPGLTEIPRVKFYGLSDPKRLDERDPTFAFSIDGLTGKEVERKLVEEHGIAMRSMKYWSMSEDFFGFELPLRASLVHYNTLEEVRMFLKAVKDIAGGR